MSSSSAIDDVVLFCVGFRGHRRRRTRGVVRGVSQRKHDDADVMMIKLFVSALKMEENVSLSYIKCKTHTHARFIIKTFYSSFASPEKLSLSPLSLSLLISLCLFERSFEWSECQRKTAEGTHDLILLQIL